MEPWFVAYLAAFLFVLSMAYLFREKARAAEELALKARAEAGHAVRQAAEDRDRVIEKLRTEARNRLEAVEEQLESERNSIRAEGARLQAHFEREYQKALESLAPLKRFEGIADAESEAQRVLTDAASLARKLRDQAQEFGAQSRQRVDAQLVELQTRLVSLRSEADAILARATSDAHNLIAQAHAKAESIAGQAYVALRERDSLQQSVEAIRNVIDGYGDRYVIPTHGFVDELAERYGHLEAGERLKAARDQTRRMVSEGLAATCDYACHRRLNTAGIWWESLVTTAGAMLDDPRALLQRI